MFKYSPTTVVVAAAIAVAVLLSGCGSTTSTGNSSSNTQDDYFTGIDRTTTVTPSSRTQTSEQQDKNLVANRETIKTNLKIGGTTQIKINRYKLTGLLRVISTTAVNLESFSYNGQCPNFSIYLTVSNDQLRVVVPFNMANRTYDNETIKIDFPGSATINDVDSVAIMCQTSDEPILLERLN